MRSGLSNRVSEFIRFFVTALGGFVIDLTVATSLILALAFSDPLAATFGLLAGMVFNYFVHLFWTFGDRGASPSFRHFGRFSIGVGVTLFVRIALLSLMAKWGLQDVLHPTLRLAIAAAISFFLSYGINKQFIFRKAADSRPEG